MGINRRDLSKVTVCNRYLDNGVALFGEPIEVMASVAPLDSYRSIQLFGESSGNNLNMVIDHIQPDVYVGDRFYIDVAVPDEEDMMATTADYVVDSIRNRAGYRNAVLKRLKI